MHHRIAATPRPHDLCRAAATTTIDLAAALAGLRLAPHVAESLAALELAALSLLIAARREELGIAPPAGRATP